MVLVSDKTATVLISTYNRADVLRETLEAMCLVDRTGLKVEFVIIDNNSTDHTGEVIDSFKDRLPIRHLFQPKQGKSAALNLALDTVELGEIVVFTDDDVVPRQDWLKRVVDACERHPDYDLFGGPITLEWPENMDMPNWVHSKYVFFVFASWDLGKEEFHLPPGENPAGANTWIRGRLCQEHRFNETLGPGDANAHGEDGMYVQELIEQGHKALYVGSCGIGHLVNTQLFDKKEVRKRALKCGRRIPVFRGISGISRKSLYDRYPILWLSYRMVVILYYIIIDWILGVPFPSDRLFLKRVNTLWLLGINLEELRMAWNQFRQPPYTES